MQRISSEFDNYSPTTPTCGSLNISSLVYSHDCEPAAPSSYHHHYQLNHPFAQYINTNSILGTQIMLQVAHHVKQHHQEGLFCNSGPHLVPERWKPIRLVLELDPFALLRSPSLSIQTPSCDYPQLPLNSNCVMSMEDFTSAFLLSLQPSSYNSLYLNESCVIGADRDDVTASRIKSSNYAADGVFCWLHQQADHVLSLLEPSDHNEVTNYLVNRMFSGLHSDDMSVSPTIYKSSDSSAISLPLYGVVILKPTTLPSILVHSGAHTLRGACLTPQGSYGHWQFIKCLVLSISYELGNTTDISDLERNTNIPNASMNKRITSLVLRDTSANGAVFRAVVDDCCDFLIVGERSSTDSNDEDTIGLPSSAPSNHGTDEIEEYGVAAVSEFRPAQEVLMQSSISIGSLVKVLGIYGPSARECPHYYSSIQCHTHHIQSSSYNDKPFGKPNNTEDHCLHDRGFSFHIFSLSSLLCDIVYDNNDCEEFALASPASEDAVDIASDINSFINDNNFNDHTVEYSSKTIPLSSPRPSRSSFACSLAASTLAQRVLSPSVCPLRHLLSNLSDPRFTVHPQISPVLSRLASSPEELALELSFIGAKTTWFEFLAYSASASHLSAMQTHDVISGIPLPIQASRPLPYGLLASWVAMMLTMVSSRIVLPPPSSCASSPLRNHSSSSSLSQGAAFPHCGIAGAQGGSCGGGRVPALSCFISGPKKVLERVLVQLAPLTDEVVGGDSESSSHLLPELIVKVQLPSSHSLPPANNNHNDSQFLNNKRTMFQEKRVSSQSPAIQSHKVPRSPNAVTVAGALTQGPISMIFPYLIEIPPQQIIGEHSYILSCQQIGAPKQRMPDIISRSNNKNQSSTWSTIGGIGGTVSSLGSFDCSEGGTTPAGIVPPVIKVSIRKPPINPFFQRKKLAAGAGTGKESSSLRSGQPDSSAYASDVAATTASLSPSCLSLHSSLYLVASDVPSADSGGATALRSLVGKCDLSLHVIDCLDDYILPLTLPVPHVASGVTPQVISQPPSLEYFIAYPQSSSTSSSRQPPKDLSRSASQLLGQYYTLLRRQGGLDATAMTLLIRLATSHAAVRRQHLSVNLLQEFLRRSNCSPHHGNKPDQYYNNNTINCGRNFQFPQSEEQLDNDFDNRSEVDVVDAVVAIFIVEVLCYIKSSKTVLSISLFDEVAKEIVAPIGGSCPSTSQQFCFVDFYTSLVQYLAANVGETPV